MLLENTNWLQVEDYLSRDDRLIFVVGACEQHGYLSLLADVRIPLAMAEEAGRRTGVLVAPPLNFGVSPAFTAYPGTMSLSVRTFLNVVEDLVTVAYAQGFRRLLLANGHGGNAPAVALLSELANRLPEVQLSWYSWWTSPSVTAIAAEAGLESRHAGWIEAFDFCRVAPLPSGAKDDVVPVRVLSADEARRAYGDGVFGGPYEADAALMERVFEAAVVDMVDHLAFG